MIECEKLCPWLLPSLEFFEAAARADRLGHAWLITGRAGTGKANLAYVLATRLLANQAPASPPAPAAPADVIADYAALEDEAAEIPPDMHRIRAEEGKRSISVDQIRAVIAELALTSHQGRGKLILIEQADLMTNEAANALLKSLEEPTARTYLLLLCDRPGRLPATVRSRCQTLAVNGPEPAAMAAWLEQGRLAIGDFPGSWHGMAPISLARILADEETLKVYKELYGSRADLFSGRADPNALAEQWTRANTERALECLSDGLHTIIRYRLIGGVSNAVTDPNALIGENALANASTSALFEGLHIAENLRDQVGRGTNVELALKALLMGLDSPAANRANR